MRAVIYTRASLDRTGEGKSNARQEDECKRLIEFKRWEYVGTEADVSISAYTEKERPAWLRVLALIEAGEVDVVVAFHLDRLTRNMADLEKLILLCEKHNVSVATATGDIDLTNDTGRMVARILAAVARQEVERKAARQRLQHTQRRAEGRPFAGVKVLGYERDGSIIEEEAEAIRAAAADVLDRDVSLAEIGRQWAAKGLTSPYKSDDKPWSPRGVKGVLTNPRLAGFVVHDGVVLGRGQWEPILDETTATLLNAKLNAPERNNGKSRQGRTAANLLTGIATCSVCEGTLRAAVKRGRETYVCGDWHVSVPREEADSLVKRALEATVQTVLPGSVLGIEVEPEESEEAIGDEIAALTKRQEVLTRSFTGGLIGEDAYEAAVSDLALKIETLREKATTPSEDADYRKAMTRALEEFRDDDLAGQRNVLERLTKVAVRPAGAGNRLNARNQIVVKVRQRLHFSDDDGQPRTSEKWITAYEPEPKGR
ncbi:recombinase family protein [Nocardioides sp.]|uniref:recombinase family protein n=1 Tax=Nocardioides sp. TaxID=35761 RepID=UPI002600B8DB|nr:recombinase family protein [Nocardioides sp.]